MIKIWEILNNWAPLPISLFAAYYSFSNYLESKPKIEIQQIARSNSSVVIEPDRLKDDFKIPDRIWHMKYRVISEILIINKSSKPITIIEMTLNEKLTYNSYSKPGEDYTVTTINKRSVVGGITMFNGNEERISFPIEDKWLNFLIDIGPNSAVRGYIYFAFDNLNDVNIGKNLLEITTSRKIFKADLYVTEAIHSQLLQEEKFDRDEHQNYL